MSASSVMKGTKSSKFSTTVRLGGAPQEHSSEPDSPRGSNKRIIKSASSIFRANSPASSNKMRSFHGLQTSHVSRKGSLSKTFMRPLSSMRKTVSPEEKLDASGMLYRAADMIDQKVLAAFPLLSSLDSGSGESWSKDIFSFNYNTLRKETMSLFRLLFSMKALLPTNLKAADTKQFFVWFTVYRELVLLILCTDDEIIFPWAEEFRVFETLEREKRTIVRKVAKGMLREIDLQKLHTDSSNQVESVERIFEVSLSLTRLLVTYCAEVETLAAKTRTVRAGPIKEVIIIRDTTRELVRQLGLAEKYYPATASAMEDSARREAWIRHYVPARKRFRWTHICREFDILHTCLVEQAVENATNSSNLKNVLRKCNVAAMKEPININTVAIPH